MAFARQKEKNGKWKMTKVNERDCGVKTEAFSLLATLSMACEGTLDSHKFATHI